MEDLNINPGHWSHSFVLSEIHTAKAWGYTPSQFRNLPEIDRVEMLAHDAAYQQMEQYEYQEIRKKGEQK